MAVKIEDLLAQQNKLLAALTEINFAKSAPRNSGYKKLRVARKHSSDMLDMPPADLTSEAGVAEYRPLYDIEGPFHGFFQDGSLRQTLMNMVVYPVDGLANSIPTRANNIVNDLYGFFMRYSVSPDDDFEEGDVCDPAIPLVSDFDFMKMGASYGRLAHSIKTLDVTNLLLQAQARQYDQFYIQGEWRGVSARPDIATFRDVVGNLNVDLIVASAMRRKLADLGTYFQRTLLNWVWTGDPANTLGGKQIIQPLGLYRLINGKYSTSGLPIVTTAHMGGPTADQMKDTLSSIVVNLDGKAVGDGTFSLWQNLRAVEQLLHQRAAGTGMLPVDWKIYMITPLWDQITENLPCEVIADGCVIPGGEIAKNFNLNDGGTALFNMTTRQQMRDSQSLTMNGRTYQVVLDDTMPYETVEDDQGNFVGYKSSIFFIPFVVAGGEQILYWEYIDYSGMYSALGPMGQHGAGAKGWTDNGYYYHNITELRNCIEMQTEMQVRLIFRTPHLAARFDNLTCRASYQYPIFLDGAGKPAGWLIQPS